MDGRRGRRNGHAGIDKYIVLFLISVGIYFHIGQLDNAVGRHVGPRRLQIEKDERIFQFQLHGLRFNSFDSIKNR